MTHGRPADADITFSIEDMARRTDQAPWVVARGIARLIARGLLETTNGTPEQAIADLQRIYGEACNGR